MMVHEMLSADRLSSKVQKVRKARENPDKHLYFRAIANARFVLRKVFRIIEDQAKAEGLDPLAHQALLQTYGSSEQSLRVKELADRLDVSSAFCSNLTRPLVEQGYVERLPSEGDLRGTTLRVTEKGKALLYRVDAAVKLHVDYFNHRLSPEEREMTVYVMMFYVGVELGA